MPIIIFLFQLVLIVLVISAIWITFTKAGHPGWAAIVPIYNIYILVKIAGRPGWWVLLFFIPLVNIVFDIIICIDIAGKFGKGAGFGIGLTLLPFIFFPIIAFSDDIKFVG